MFSCKTWSPDRFGLSGSFVGNGGTAAPSPEGRCTRLPVSGPDRGGESGNVSNLPTPAPFHTCRFQRRFRVGAMIPTMRSLPDPHALSTHLADRYGLGFTGCTLLRSLVNDVYELTTGDARYVLKLYRHDGRDPDEIRWEAGLSAHLRTAGLQVPPVSCCPTEMPSDYSRHLKDPGRSSCPVSSRAPNRSRLSTTSCTTHSAGNSRHSTMPPTTTIRRTRDARPISPIGFTNRSNRSWPSTARRKTCSGPRGRSTEQPRAVLRPASAMATSLRQHLLTPQGLLLLRLRPHRGGPRAADFTGVATTPYWHPSSPGTGRAPDHGDRRRGDPVSRDRRPDLQPAIPPGRQADVPRHRVPHRGVGRW